MDLYTTLETAFRESSMTPITASGPRQLHSMRARIWVERLAANLRNQYPDDAVRVLSKYDSTNRKEFGLNELLYDILVCRVNTASSKGHGKPFFYVEDVLWQIESEFARDRRHALYDFNKLVLGAGQNKLFVGPQVHDNSSYLQTLLPAAKACGGNVFVALVPHPRDWGNGVGLISLWKYGGENWGVLK